MEIANRLNILKALAGIRFFDHSVKVESVKELDILAFKILTAAKRRTPVRTGALRASGRVDTKGKSTRIIGFGGAGTGVNYAASVEYGSANQRPQPFLRPAFYAVRNSYKRGLISKAKRSWSVASRIGSS